MASLRKCPVKSIAKLKSKLLFKGLCDGDNDVVISLDQFKSFLNLHKGESKEEEEKIEKYNAETCAIFELHGVVKVNEEVFINFFE